jgi:8-oxo-dGTP pyrophosphatase MutT (NUDIX family)
MEVFSTVIDKPARPAATLMLLRDAQDGLEVFLLKRHGLSDVLGGAYVFPGGKLDLEDSEIDVEAHLDQTPERLHEALGEPATDLATATGLYVAALREAFEESGVLLAGGRAGAGADPISAACADAAQAREAMALSRQGMSWGEVLAHMGLRLATRAALPWSRWITPRVPSVMSKRFDTRFFVAALPAGQTARHDNRETVQSVWLAPREALRQYWAREIELAPPQIMSLAHLSRFADVAGALQHAHAHRPPVIQPEPFDDDGSRVICYPGDERHPIRVRAMPGPSRLRHVKGRFEPVGGFEALFD